ncbi:vacuolar protein sorting-associated protein 26 isoform X1 [Wolffia australiana]
MAFGGMLLLCICLHLLEIRNSSVVIKSSGKLAPGTNEIPFSISLSNDGKTGYQRFYDTFHGGNISIQYLVTAELSRGYLQKSLSVTKEYIVECDKGFTSEQSIRANVVSFYITQDTQKHQLMPELTIAGHFRVTGTIPTECAISSPLCGELIVESSAVIIRSIDILLLRVESILAGERIITEAATVQTTQIADGDVCRSLAIPIYVILPRLLVCPTLIAGPFSVEFQVSISITFESELSKLYSKSDLKTPMPWVVLETLPLRIY